MAELGNKELSSRVIEAAIKVHKALGPGFLESVYETAFCVELQAQGIAFERQKTVKLFYRDVVVGEHRLDVVVEGKMLVELKTVQAIEDIFFVIGRSQMKAAGLPDGLLFNFHSMPLTIRRIAPEQHSGFLQGS
ncbi:MAG: GxxExxY protein [Nibricoccus sp.]